MRHFPVVWKFVLRALGAWERLPFEESLQSSDKCWVNRDFGRGVEIDFPERIKEALFQMQVLSADDVAKWFQGFENLGPHCDYVQADEDGLFYTNPEATCITLEYPAKLERLPFFAHYVATIGYEDRHFDGALIWFHNWGVWNLFEEGIGYRIVERIDAGAGQPKAFEVAVGHRFRSDELADAIGMLMQPMIFAWDSFYLPQWSYGSTSDFFLHVSHHSVVDVVTRTRVFHAEVVKKLEELHLDFKPGSNERVERFCHPRAAKSR